MVRVNDHLVVDAEILGMVQELEDQSSLLVRIYLNLVLGHLNMLRISLFRGLRRHIDFLHLPRIILHGCKLLVQPRLGVLSLQ